MVTEILCDQCGASFFDQEKRLKEKEVLCENCIIDKEKDYE